MMILKNLKSYSPSGQQSDNGILFLKDEDGNDWYENQKNFARDTLKIAYNNDGVICSAYADVSMLWPIGLTVTEVKRSSVPNEFAVDGNWLFDGETIKARTYTESELSDIAASQREQRMALASAMIAPLQDAVDLGDATDDEVASLKKWKTYRVALSRVDLVNPVWPEAPRQA